MLFVLGARAHAPSLIFQAALSWRRTPHTRSSHVHSEHWFACSLKAASGRHQSPEVHIRDNGSMLVDSHARNAGLPWSPTCITPCQLCLADCASNLRSVKR